MTSTLTDRALQQVLKRTSKDPDGCWRYHPPSSQRGRPRVTVSGRTMAAYEVVWLAYTRQEVPQGMQLLHSCDNGENGCVNPGHLRIGTPSENVQDALDRQRWSNQNVSRTVCKRGHLLEGDNVILRKDGRRNCRTCDRERRQRADA